MITIKMGYRDQHQLMLMSEWLAENTGGTSVPGPNGGMRGPGWLIYHMSEMRKLADGPNPLPYLITRVEIDNPEMAIMFRLRWT